MSTAEPSRGERTRAEIEQAALRLFLQNGFHGTSMRQIAQEAGIAVGGIYNHYRNKEDIFIEVIQKHHPIYRVIPVLSTVRGDTVETFFHDAAILMVREIGERMEFLNLIFIELVEFKGIHIPQLVEEIFPQVIEFAQHVLTNRDELRPIPLPVLVRVFLGLFFSYVMTEMLFQAPPSKQFTSGALEHFVDIYLHGILKEKSE